jgi:cytochrome c oxidase assembly factor CtaG
MGKSLKVYYATYFDSLGEVVGQSSVFATSKQAYACGIDAVARYNEQEFYRTKGQWIMHLPADSPEITSFKVLYMYMNLTDILDYASKHPAMDYNKQEHFERYQEYQTNVQMEKDMRQQEREALSEETPF